MTELVKLYWSPLYAWARPQWLEYRDLYEGDHDVMARAEYLWPHLIETRNDQDAKDLRASRERRTQYLFLMEILISVWGGFFFRKQPNFSKVKDLLDTRLDNIDGQNTSFFSLLKDQATRDFLLYGKTILLASNSPHQMMTLKEEREKGMRPYLLALNPLDVTDWDIETQDPERVGKFNLLRHEFTLVEPRRNSTEKPEVNRYCHVYRRGLGGVDVDIYKVTLNLDGTMPKEFLPDLQKLEQKWEVAGNAVLDLPEIPAVQLCSRSAANVEESWVKGAAAEIKRCHNLRSCRDNIQYMQGYASDYITGVDPGNQALRAAVGEYARMLLPEGANPIRLAPVPMADYDKAVQDSIDLVFKLGLNLFRTIPADSRVGQSAESMSEEKDNPLALVESTLESLENFTNAALEHFAAFMGETAPTEKIVLHKQVSEQAFNRFTVVVNSLRDYIKRSDKAEKEIAKRAVEYLEFEEEQTQEINREIDSSKRVEADMSSQRELFRKAINGDRPAAPPAQTEGDRSASEGVSIEA